MRQLLFFVCMILGFGVTTSCLAESDNQRKLKNTLKNVFGDNAIEINDHDDQLKRVSVDSGDFFISHDGRYIFAGKVFDTVRNVDITAELETVTRQNFIRNKPKELFVQYPSTVKEKYNVTVFTDINCAYCRKLHDTMSVLNQKGISVNYVMMPRGDANSAPYAKTLSALCSDDPAASITQAMQNHDPEVVSCDSSQLEQHIELARALKVNSTPTFVLPNGELQVGYVSPDRLLKLLETSGVMETNHERS